MKDIDPEAVLSRAMGKVNRLFAFKFGLLLGQKNFQEDCFHGLAVGCFGGVNDRDIAVNSHPWFLVAAQMKVRSTDRHGVTKQAVQIGTHPARVKPARWTGPFLPSKQPAFTWR